MNRSYLRCRPTPIDNRGETLQVDGPPWVRGPEATLTDANFENPQFQSLGGKWCAWTAGEDWRD